MRPVQMQSMHGSRGGNRGFGPPAKSQVYRVSSNTGPDPLKITKLTSQHSMWAIIGPLLVGFGASLP